MSDSRTSKGPRIMQVPRPKEKTAAPVPATHSASRATAFCGNGEQHMVTVKVQCLI